MQTGKRASEIGDLVRHNTVTKFGIAFAILVGVDQQFINLRRQIPPMRRPRPPARMTPVILFLLIV